jgi:hypothetical protein
VGLHTGRNSSFYHWCDFRGWQSDANEARKVERGVAPDRIVGAVGGVGEDEIGAGELGVGFAGVDESVGGIGLGRAEELLGWAPGAFEAGSAAHDDVGGTKALGVDFEEAGAARVGLQAGFAAGVVDDGGGAGLGDPVGAGRPEEAVEVAAGSVPGRQAGEEKIVLVAAVGEEVDEVSEAKGGGGEDDVSVVFGNAVECPGGGVVVGVGDEEGDPACTLEAERMGIAVCDEAGAEKEQRVAEANAAGGPEPGVRLGGEEFRRRVGRAAPEKADGGGGGVVAGLQGDGVADKGGVGAVVSWVAGDEGVAEVPEDAAVAEVDGEGGVGAEPERVAVEEPVGGEPGCGCLRQGHGGEWSEGEQEEAAQAARHGGVILAIVWGWERWFRWQQSEPFGL